MLSVILMRAGIQLDNGVFIDARNAPIALIGLFEGWTAVVIAAAITAVSRLWIGGAGAWAGVVSVVLVAVSAGLVHGWARRDGGVAPKHALSLAALAALALLPALAMLGARGFELFTRLWAGYATLIMLSVGLMARRRRTEKSIFFLARVMKNAPAQCTRCRRPKSMYPRSMT